MASRFLEFSPSAATSLKIGTPTVIIETGFFMRFPYPQNVSALEECEQAFWRRDCVPCFAAVIRGKLKAGLSKEEADLLCSTQSVCSRWELPMMFGAGKTAAADASAAMAIARLTDVVPVLAPGLSDSLADLDALASSERLVFCRSLSEDTSLLFTSRGVPVLRGETNELSTAYLVQRELELSEGAVVPCGSTLKEMADICCAVAVDLKKKSNFS